MSSIASREVEVDGLTFGVLEAGSGPLALCLHGFPDTAHTWRHLLPALAEAGFHAVAPFMRGYAPSGIPADGCYSLGALVADTEALHDALGGDGDAVLVGHDWGASIAYGAAAFAPRRWRRLVTLAVPPYGVEPALVQDYAQLRRSFYMFFFLIRDAEALVAAEEMAFLDRLWAEWSPGYDGTADMDDVRASLGEPANLAAALGYYRAELGTAATGCSAFAAEEAAVLEVAPQPTLYLHGASDGCISSEFAELADEHLSPGSRTSILDGVGHFLHLEQPEQVNAAIVDWVTAS